MRDLEELVERLEQGDLPLEESLAAFERGVMLTRSCQTALKEAEQKVEILLKKAGEPPCREFYADETKGEAATRLDSPPEGRLAACGGGLCPKRASGPAAEPSPPNRLISLHSAVPAPFRA